MGEPAGIGGEITLKAWQHLQWESDSAPFFMLDDPDRLTILAKRLGIDVPVIKITKPAEAALVFRKGLPVLPVKLAAPVKPGILDPANGAAVVASIDQAVALARSGEASAIVTNPIHKAALYACGFAYPGHTEYLAALAGVEHPVMMLASPDLRVVPLTIHIPLMDVARHLTQELVIRTAETVHAALRDQFGIAEPRLALSGLNPHAGENGSIGREEIDVLEPAVAILRAGGMLISGPHSADTLFHAAARQNYDAALCPTHDQALIPIKTLAFDEGVNVTLGLPFIRTSPDHGTALDIADKGIARPDSFLAALRLAETLERKNIRKIAA